MKAKLHFIRNSALLMTKLFAGAGLFLAFSITQAATTEYCKFPYTELSKSHGYIEMKFPDGRVFTLLGRNHGNPETAVQIIPAITDQDSSNKDYVEKLKSLHAKNATAIAHSKEEVGFLKERLSGKTPQFLALEATEIAGKLRMGFAAYINQQATDEFLRRGIDDPALRRDSVFLSSNSEGYLALTEPGLIKKTHVFGADHPDLELLPADIDPEFDEFKKLIEAVGPDSKLAKDLIDFRRKITVGYMVFDTIPGTVLQDKLLEQIPAKYHSLTKAWLVPLLRLTQGMNTRDKHIVNQLLSQETSGILLIGHDHLQSLTIRLKAECDRAVAKTTSRTQQKARSSQPTESKAH